ncbi:MAG: DUF2269 family protein [Actinobacteria bacterium]|nr:DUF2269 family protein [Actinomycetota bacterium]
MSYYEILLFLHITAAVIWLGSGFFVQMLVGRAERTNDRLLLKQFSAYPAWMAQRIFIPASLAVLVLGILLTIEGPWSFDQLWIVLGLVGYAISFLTGILFIEPQGKRIYAAIEAHGPESPQAALQLARINVVSRLELVVLYLVVYVMALKPSADDTGTLIVGAAVVLGALAYFVPKLRAAMPGAPATAD